MSNPTAARATEPAFPPPRRPEARISLRYAREMTRSPACYLEMGRSDGPPLLFLHGFSGDLLTWHYCLTGFMNRFRVIAVDLPGHGRSTMDVGDGSLRHMIEWVEEFFAALGLDEAHLVGHSMGGKIGIALAMWHPKRVKSLSMISPAGLGGFYDLPLLKRFLDCDGAKAPEEIAARLLGPASSDLLPALTRALAMTVEAPARQAAFAALLGDAAAIGGDISGESIPWHRVTCPVQTIWGESDTVLPLPEAWRLPPGAPLHVLPGIGHLAQIECPGQVTELLDRFLP